MKKILEMINQKNNITNKLNTNYYALVERNRKSGLKDDGNLKRMNREIIALENSLENMQNKNSQKMNTS